MRKFLRMVFEKDWGEFYTGSLWSVSAAFFMFVMYKLTDFLYSATIDGYEAAHFGQIVQDFQWLQWVFQFAAFMGCSLTIYFFRSFKKARSRAQDRNGAITKVQELTEEIAHMGDQMRIERERYRLILDRQNEMVTKFRLDGTITFVNRSNYSFHGFTHWSEMVGKNLYDFVKVSCPDLKERIATISKDNPREHHIETMFSIDGRIAYVDWVNCGIFNESGELVGIQSVGRDITAQVEANERLRLSEERYRLLFSYNISGYAIHSIVCDSDTGDACDYLFLEVNPAFERMFGFRAGDIIGRTVLAVMPNTEPSLIKRFGDVAATGNSDNFHCYFKDINKWFEVSAFKPQENHFAATFIDITKWKDRTGKKERSGDK